MTKDRKKPRIRYDEGCLAAHALNIMGDRWALLVVRELMLGPKRFGAIRARVGDAVPVHEREVEVTTVAG